MNIKEEAIPKNQDVIARNPESNANGSSISFDELDRLRYEKMNDS